LLRDAGWVDKVFDTELFGGELLFHSVLRDAGRTDFVKDAVIGVAKRGGKEHYDGETEGNENEAKTKTHNSKSNIKYQKLKI